ncbi:MAG: hypothetical protein M4579_006703 [Chaenotheca gracillima]|nr:MAG: hypothetical protein M4579_006703 [Chaenotheca gracillima]
MDSINNAAKKIWGGDEGTVPAGESGREPVSGVTGSGSAGEPYDAGNTTNDPSLSGTAGPNAQTSSYGSQNPRSSNAGPHDTNTGNKLDPRIDSDRDGSSATGGGYSSTTNTSGGATSYDSQNPRSSNAGPHDSNTGNKLDPRIDSDRDGSSATGGGYSSTTNTSGGPTSHRLAGESDTSTGPGISQGQNVAGGIRPEHQTDKTGVTGLHSNDAKFSDPNPSSSNEGGRVQPSVGADPSSGQSGAQKQQGADRPGVEPSDESTGAIRDRKNVTEDVAGGDKTSGAPVGGDPNRKKSEGQAGGRPHDEEKKKNEGTGTIYVKSSGMAADGGDFDATKPGAGREADRLLEEKGVQRAGGPPTSGGDASSNVPGESKPGVGDKIKGKLHLGSH